MLLSIIKETILRTARENPALVYLSLTISVLVGIALFSYSYTIFALKSDMQAAIEQRGALFEAAREDTKKVIGKVADDVAVVSDQVKDLSVQTAELDRNTRVRALEAVIRALDAEIFELEELIRAGAATEKQRARYAQLRSDRADQERRLSWLTK